MFIASATHAVVSHANSFITLEPLDACVPSAIELEPSEEGAFYIKFANGLYLDYELYVSTNKSLFRSEDGKIMVDGTKYFLAAKQFRRGLEATILGNNPKEQLTLKLI